MFADKSVSKISLFFGHVSSNIGDIAINSGTVNLLLEAYPDANINAVLLSVEKSPHLNSSIRSFGREDRVAYTHFNGDAERSIDYSLDPGQFMEECQADDSDLVVVAAGEHIFDYKGKDNSKNLFWRTLPVLGARAKNISSIVLPSTFGPFETESSHLLLSEIYKSGGKLSVRDRRSKDELAKLFPDVNFSSLLDPAFFLERVPCEINHDSQKKSVVGIVMRSEGWGLRLLDATRDSKTKEFEDNGYVSSLSFNFSFEVTRRILEETDKRVRFFVQIEADRPIADAVLSNVREKFPQHLSRVEIITPDSIASYLNEIEAVDCIIASRFHALVMGLVSQKPVLGTYFESHGHKIPGLFDLLDEESLCFNLDEVSCEEASRNCLKKIVSDDFSFRIFERKIAELKAETVSWLQQEDKKHKSDSEGFQLVSRGSLMYARDLIKYSHEDGLRRLKAKLYKQKREHNKKDQDLEERFSRIKAREKKVLNENLTLENKNIELSKEVEQEKEKQEALDKKASREARRASGIERQLEIALESTSYKLGNKLVEVVKKPKAFIELPSALFDIWHERNEKGGKNKGEIGTTAITTYKSKGAEGVADKILSGNFENDKVRSRALVSEAKKLKQSGYPEAEYDLIKKAVEIHRSEANLRALYWSATKLHYFSEAHSCAKEIINSYGSSPTKEQKEFIEKYRRSPVNQLSIIDSIPKSKTISTDYRLNRICYVLHNSLPYSSGGYATRAHGISKGLASHGVEVVAITRPGFPLDIKPELSASEVVLEDTVDGILYKRVLSPLRSDYPASQYMSLAADYLVSEIERNRPDAVIAASNHVTALPALIASRRLGLPFFYEVRGFWEITRVSREPDFIDNPSFKAQEILEAEVAKQAEHVFTLTGPMKQELVRRGVDADNITVSPNSCDPEVFNPRERDLELARKLDIPDGVLVIGYIGTFVQYEGLDDLASAAGKLKDWGHEFRLLLVGNENASGSDTGPITAEILKIAAEHGFSDWLIMPGRVPYEEVASYYSLIDISPFPRKPQPVTELVSPMKPLEALSMEKAVVVSDVRALSEMIDHNVTGLHFRKGNIHSLAESLELLLTNKGLVSELGRNGRDWVIKNRTWKAAAKSILDSVREIG